VIDSIEVFKVLYCDIVRLLTRTRDSYVYKPRRNINKEAGQGNCSLWLIVVHSTGTLLSLMSQRNIHQWFHNKIARNNDAFKSPACAVSRLFSVYSNFPAKNLILLLVNLKIERSNLRFKKLQYLKKLFVDKEY